MSRFILVHGAWHGAWCFDHLIPEVAALGGRATAIDMPGHGPNGQPGWRHGMDDYARAVVAACREAGTGAIAVGHSMGGLVIARAAELDPDAVSRLVFLCAFLPQPGDSLMSLGREARANGVPSVVVPDPIFGLARIRRDRAPDVFFQDCSADMIAAARPRLQHQSVRPMFAGARISPERFGRARRFYIAARQDRAIPHGFQQTMLARVPCEDVVTLDSSHSPFMSRPQETAAALMRFAAR